MKKVIRCRDVGYDCDGVIKADSEEELLQMVASHARSEHGLEQVSEEALAKIRSVISNE